MSLVQKITPCLWFDHQAEEAAAFYVSIFPDSRIHGVTRYTRAGQEIHQKPVGSVLTVEFELNGQPFTALNGGPIFQFNEAISLQVVCRDQQEIDYYWEKLGEGGDPRAQQCGWLKDKYGVAWQVFPARLKELIRDHESDRTVRVLEAMFQMKKMDLAALERAAEG